MPAENPTRERRTNDVRHGDGGHKDRAGFGAVFIAEPMGEIDDDSGEESSFRHTEQESSQIELARRVHSRQENGDQSPGDEDARHPLAGAPALHDQRAGYLEEEVTDGEDARAQSKDAVAEMEVAGHLQAGVAHIHTVQKSDYVKDEEERQQAAGDAPSGALFCAGENCGGRHWGSAFVAQFRGLGAANQPAIFVAGSVARQDAGQKPQISHAKGRRDLSYKAAAPRCNRRLRAPGRNYELRDSPPGLPPKLLMDRIEILREGRCRPADTVIQLYGGRTRPRYAHRALLRL